MRVRLAGERRERLVRALQRWYADELDETLSDFNAGRVVDFFVAELGPPVYNQAIRDAHGFLQEKLQDLEVEFYEPDEPADG
jgi:uncharacterized protein (DUF2164 family)